MHDSIAQWHTVRTLGAFQRPIDADKFAFQGFGSSANNGVAVTGKIKERQMGRELWIRHTTCRRDVAAAPVLEARAYPMAQQKIYDRLWLVLPGAMSEIQAIERMVFGESM